MVTTASSRSESPSGRTGPPQQLPWTGDADADRLNAAAPVALLIGFVLDQQVTVQQAFSGPLEIRRRLGTLDPVKLAAVDPVRMREAFAGRPAIHRFPKAMADRVQALCVEIVDTYAGDAEAIWRDAADAEDLRRRLGRLPGFGPMKAATVLRLLTFQFGLRPGGYERLLPDHPTLGDVTTAEELTAYQTQKRAHKAALRAATPASVASPRGRRR